jgi:hypothetical protein
MTDEFARIQEAFRTGGADGVFDLLIRTARETGNYRVLFDASIMRVRHRLGLPLIETQSATDLTGEPRAIYEAAFRDAAREAGELCLAGGDIPSAWPYFKAIGEPAKAAAAIESVDGGENLDRVIEIAYQEGVNPRKGFELILEHRGICSAITWFDANRDRASRQACLRLLVETLYREIAGALKRTIAQAEGVEPGTDRVAELIAGRDWLFDNMSTYTDATHLTSILRYAPELEDAPSLRMALEMAEYGQRLDPMYRFRSDPPFDDTYRDYAVYLRALLGEEVEAGIAHFRAKVARPEDTFAAEVLINLLSRLERFADAIQISREYLPEATLQLCQLAGDYSGLRDAAREREDVVGFAAGLLQG